MLWDIKKYLGTVCEDDYGQMRVIQKLFGYNCLLGPVHMGRSYLCYRENISTSLQARSRLVMK